MRIVFMGTPDFAVPSLEALIRRGHEIAAVYTQPDKPKGRGHQMQAPPVKTVAEKNGIPVLQPQTLRDAVAQETLRAFQPELIVVAAYGKILPSAVLEMPPLGCINVHGSLLPKYRGAAPIQWAVLNGDEVTGVTIMRMAEGIDTGDMYSRHEMKIGENETSGELFDRLKALGADLLAETLDRLPDLKPEPQEEALATRAPMIQKEMGAVNFTQSARTVHNLVRGLNPWPSAYFTLDGARLKLHRTAVVEKSGTPGTCALLDGEFIVFCGENAVALLEVQPENGKRMRGSDYLRGHPLADGTRV